MKEKIIILCGGVGEESKVSLVSGHAVWEALKDEHEVQLIELTENVLPEYLRSAEALIFPAMHGEFGEDGQIQKILEEKGFHFVGSGSRASRICMHKPTTKRICRDAGFAVLDEMVFSEENKPLAKVVLEKFGKKVILKPTDKGSSVGLQLLNGEGEIEAALQNELVGEWMIEPFLKGREMAISVIAGESMEVLEIAPPGEMYDYYEKYTGHDTKYTCPAPINEWVRDQMRFAASEIFRLCGCRDFARVDFIVDAEDRFYLMEVNTIPGLRPQSLFSRSAAGTGHDFKETLERVLSSARERALVWL